MKKRLIYLLFALLVSFSLLSQNERARNIRGTVTDAGSGEPLIGVSVFAPVSGAGVATDLDGKYAINVSPNDTTLHFSFVGYSAKSVNINNQTQIDVTLAEDIQSLEEVVVVGYGTQRKSDLTGAISVVDMKEISKRSVASLDQALQGQVAGVDVTSVSGSPGSSVMVRVRGIGTLNNSSPLYVVDGMMVGDINFLNMNDIESVQVLKDASATAIYGSRGANGVVIMTTKKGQKGSSVINFSTYYGIQNPWRSNNVCDGPTWGYLRNEMSVGLGGDILIQDPSTLPTVDYFKAITEKNAPVSNIDLSISGGMEKGTYFFSLNKFSQNGIIKKTGFDRITLRANSDYMVKPWLKVGENITLVKTDQKSQYENDEWTTPIITSFTRDPVTPIKNEEGAFTKSTYSDQWNPVAIIEYNNPKSLVYRAIANIYADISFLKNFIFRTSYSTEYSNNEYSNYIPVYYVFSAQQNPNVNSLTNSTYSSLIKQFTNTLTYEKRAGLHNISAMIGAESYSVFYKSLEATVKDIPSNDPNVIFIDNAKTKDTNASARGITSQGKQLSALARLNYSYMDKYLLTANFRADGSSKFVKGNRWGKFPSISLGWRVSEEPFMKSVEFLDNLKLRAGWGQIGNEASVDSYSYATFASSGANYPFGGVFTPGFSFNSTGNSELKWEKTTTTNVGVDFGLFNNKFSGTVELFNKITDDMLLRVPVPGQAGIMYPAFQNAGKMSNKGIEVSLQYKNFDHPLNYSLGVNFTTIKNEVLDLGSDKAFIDGASYLNTAFLTRTVVGKPIAQFYGLKTDGLFQNWDEVHAQTAQTNVAPGDVKYITVNKDDLFSSENYTFLGSPLPKFTYSFNANLAYKGFDLSCTLQGVYGNKVYNGPSIYVRSTQNLSYNYMRDMVNRWRGEGTQNDAKYPRFGGLDANNSIVQSDRYLEDGSYLRIKVLQLGYSIPAKYTKKAGIENIRFYANAQNLYTFTKYTGLDPEIGMRGGTDPLDIGVDRGYYPTPRLYSLGLNVTF
ncbi:SusC/RagA family TonB-linked outer membrane protein [Petrimonas sp.]|uniref:SusC/RagA family TonB-linked outer membrane protein n=1 Tax=Petrimonas sp. TaxID=2023866 RepID=UPI003F513073